MREQGISFVAPRQIVADGSGTSQEPAFVPGPWHPHDQAGHGRLAGRVPLPAQHAADVFLKKETDPSTKQFDDDEWIRSLNPGRQCFERPARR